MAQRGFLLIADITGYTTYLSESELEHAHGTLTDLLELLIEHTRPPLRISGLAGDAVLSYSFDEGFVSPQTFVESIEDTYVAFRRAIELMVLNNTCQCNACANVSSLDLKFFVHHGSFVLQNIGEYEELVGSDVNLIHRLLKNNVTEELGFGAYLLCTEAAELALGLTDDDRSGRVRHVENITEFGDVVCWITDMHPVYQDRKDEALISYEDSEILADYEVTIALPPEIVWDYLTQSSFREILLASDGTVITDRVAGRVGEGTVYQCYHGEHVIPQVVVEWRPMERIVVKATVPVPGGPVDALNDSRLTSSGDGTKLTQTIARVTGPLLGRVVFRAMVRKGARQDRRLMAEFARAIEADYISRAGAPDDESAVTADEITLAATHSLHSNHDD